MKKLMHVSKDRPTMTVSLKMPVDVMDDLKAVSQAKEMSSVEALIQFYVGQGLRRDLADLRRKHSVEQAKHILDKYNIDPKIIEEVVTVMS